jgi:hypothetical protein
VLLGTKFLSLVKTIYVTFMAVTMGRDTFILRCSVAFSKANNEIKSKLSHECRVNEIVLSLECGVFYIYICVFLSVG